MIVGTVGISWRGSDFAPKPWFAFATFEHRRAFNSFECGDVPFLHLAMKAGGYVAVEKTKPGRDGGIRQGPHPRSPMIVGTVGISWRGSDFAPKPWFAFATFEHRRAFNSFECGDVPFLHLAMKAGGYVAVEKTKPGRDGGIRQGPHPRSPMIVGTVGISWRGSDFAPKPWFAFATFEHRRAFNSFECGDVPFLHLAMKAGGYVAVEKTKPGRDGGIRQGPHPRSPMIVGTVGISWRGSDFAPKPWFAFATFEHRRAFNSFECGDVPFLHLAMKAGGYVAVEKTKPGRDGGIRQGPHPRSPMIVGTVGISWRGSDFAPKPWFAFATFEHRRAFNSFECGDVPFLHLAMKAGGYVAVEKTKPGRDGGIRQGPHPRSPMIVGTVGISWRGSDFAPKPWFAFATFEHRRAFNSFECGDVPFLHLAMKAGGYVAVEKTKPGRDGGIRQGPHPRSPMIVGTVGISWRGSDFAPKPWFAFATFEHRRAFNSFECGDVPFLHLAMKAGGYGPFLHLAMKAGGYGP